MIRNIPNNKRNIPNMIRNIPNNIRNITNMIGNIQNMIGNIPNSIRNIPLTYILRGANWLTFIMPSILVHLAYTTLYYCVLHRISYNLSGLCANPGNLPLLPLVLEGGKFNYDIWQFVGTFGQFLPPLGHKKLSRLCRFSHFSHPSVNIWHRTLSFRVNCTTCLLQRRGHTICR